MRGGCRTFCDVQARRPKSSYLLPRHVCEAAVGKLAVMTWSSLEAAVVYLLPCRGCKAAAALPAALQPGSRSRPTCCLAVDARRLSHFLRRSSPETKVVLPAASPWMRGGCRTFCDVQARRPKSSYLLPRRGCEAAVALSATFKPGDQSRPTCCLAVDARRLSHFLRRSSPETKVVLPAASPWMRGGCRQTCRHDLEFIGGGSRLLAALPWMQGGGRLTCCSTAWMQQSSYAPPRQICEAAFVIPTASSVYAGRLPTYLPFCHQKTAVILPSAVLSRGCSLSTCRLAVYARRQSSTCRLDLEA